MEEPPMIRQREKEMIQALRRLVVTVMAGAGALACIAYALRSLVQSLLRALIPN